MSIFADLLRNSLSPFSDQYSWIFFKKISEAIFMVFLKKSQRSYLDEYPWILKDIFRGHIQVNIR